MTSAREVLELPEDPDPEAIDRAYRRRIKEAHPDHGGSADEFQAVKAAYEELTEGREGVSWFREGGRWVTGRASASAGREGANGNGATGGSTSAGGSGSTSARGPGPFGRGRRGPPGAGSSNGHRAEATKSKVEYLNYEVVSDMGWSLEDEDLFEKAAEADLTHDDRGRFLAEPDESLLQAAENRGFSWPYSCRGGACANCAVAVAEGEMAMPVDHILPEELTDQGIQLSCVGAAASEDMKVVYNVKHLPDLDELLLPARPFEQSSAD